ncbi:hypothetical protein D9613_011679 [Agrocybe pediades]|uniref:Uncharacterized protein n=1 Tax=Agrocybe pediades TaxID=84607 RepID=A0A8H4VQ36_9AGAR|nr:hypothetical protein D9613_011679 [Agrocybe pediades]
MPDTGLLFVYGENGSKVTEQEFNDWYDNDHGPARLTVPGFSNAVRYKATDGLSPTWLAIYDMATPDVAYSDAYKALSAGASEKEKDLISRLQILNRRIYKFLSVQTHPNATTFPSSHGLAVTFLVSPELEQDFNDWYEKEHIAEILKVPGCLRARRFKLVESVELTGSEHPPPEKTHQYLAFYDWNNDDYTTTPEFKAAIETPWSVKHITSAKEVSIRRFRLHKDIQKPQ